MPELPEVETVATRLRAVTSGRIIQSVVVVDPKLSHVIHEPSPVGARIQAVVRHGKFLTLHLNNDHVLLMHMMMTGRILVRPAGHAQDAYLRINFGLDRQLQLRFCDPRRFGTVRLISPTDYLHFKSRLGIEPFSKQFKTDILGELFKNRTVAIKTLLLNQSLIVGVGNIYADEGLWRARLNPLTPAESLNRNQIKALVRGIRGALRDGLRAGGTTFSRYTDADGQPGRNQENLKVFRRSAQPCPRCHISIQKTPIGGRTSHFCPNCQEC